MSDSFEMPIEEWSSAVNEVTIGATEEDGGTRSHTVTVGGEKTLPFLHYEAQTSNPPVIAMEVLDRPRDDWAPALDDAFGDVKDDPAAWAARCVDDFGAELICLNFEGADPDDLDRSPAECAEIATDVLEAVSVPLIVWGSGNYEKDNDLWTEVSPALAGERCILASAVEDNYRTISASALADKHIVLNEAPLDINIQKQVNVLVTEMGVPESSIIMYQTTGAVGYGVEYAYSILERTRLAALDGDAMLGMPMLSVVGSEAWKVKEATAPEEEMPQWGDLDQRGIIWEAATATVFLNGGTDILVMWHPDAVNIVRETINELMEVPSQ